MRPLHQPRLHQPAEPDHEAASFTGDCAADLAAQISLVCMKFFVRVAHVSAYTSPHDTKHHAVVVFEREPVQR